MSSLRVTLMFTVLTNVVVLAQCGSMSLGGGVRGEVELELKHDNDKIFKWKWNASKDLLVRTYAVKEGRIMRLELIDMMHNIGYARARLLSQMGGDTVKIKYFNDGKHNIKFRVRAFGLKGSKPYNQFVYNN